jgi:high-affinity iron transporter
LTYGNPEVGAIGTNGGWQIFNSLFGWNNNATIGTILSYVFYWIAVMFALVFHKWKEGRVTFCGFSSSAHKRMAVNRAEREKVAREQTPTSPSLGDTSESGTRLVADKAPESPLEEKRNNLEGQTPVLTA